MMNAFTYLSASEQRRAATTLTEIPSDGDRSKTATRETVLVVDDTDDVRELYADALRDAGYDVFTATNGQEAIALAARVRPRLILMDLAMPDVDGWEATRHIRASTPASEPRPTILVVSAYAGPQARGEAFDSGADGFIDKPCTPDMLVSVVGVFLQSPPRQ